ncbi:hypothetical protein ACO03V_14380 [Microbacterium sp. HMH0099]|uniref:hypothetical protein n=1 Tax=Microbacterium sp. HMH0099 TaxID=3414026 RepID=UPI003BF751D9
MSDDALADALRRLDPARTPVDAPLPLDAERRVREIVGRPVAGARRAPRARRRFALPGVVAACVAVLLAVVVGVIAAPAPSASALTPDPLAYRPVSDSVAEVIDEAQDRLAEAGGVNSSERRSLSLGWYFSATADDADAATVFRREWVDLRWNADLSGQIVTTAAEATNAAGDTVPSTDPTPGTLISELTFRRGQYSPISFETPEATPDAMADWIRLVTGADEIEAADAIVGARRMLEEWTLTDAQESALLDVVEAAPDATVLGETTDRLGRPAVAVAGVPSDTASHELALLISTETGRILGLEDTLRDADPALKLPADSVAEYILWDVDAWKNGMR